MSWDGVWEKGMVLAMRQDGPGHLVTDTGMQLLTSCGRRVTYLGARVDTSWWFRVDRPGCFECRPSPMIEWAQQQGAGSVRPDEETDARVTLDNTDARYTPTQPLKPHYPDEETP